jgi:hypothetical protein
VWKQAKRYTLLPTAAHLTNPRATRTEVQFAADAKTLVVRARLPEGEGSAGPTKPASDLILFQDHLRLVVWDGEHLRNFAVTPNGLRFSDCDKKEDSTTAWDARLTDTDGAMVATVSIPLELFPQSERIRINVIKHRRLKDTTKKALRRAVAWELCPAYRLGNDPDVIPDWNFVPPARSTETAEKTSSHFAALSLR